MRAIAIFEIIPAYSGFEGSSPNGRRDTDEGSEHTSEVALVGEAAADGDFHQGCVTVHDHCLRTLNTVAQNPAMRRVSGRGLERPHKITHGKPAMRRKFLEREIIVQKRRHYLRRTPQLPGSKGSGFVLPQAQAAKVCAK